MRKHTFLTKRQKKRASLRRLYGNPWDSTSSSSKTRTKTSSKKMSSIRSKTSKKSVTFREPIERSASKSKSKSSSNVWRTVSSKSISK